MPWLALFEFSLITVVQEMCGRIGIVTGRDLASVIKKRYSKVIFPIASLLLIANTINIGADIGAMAASIRLVFPRLPMIVATISFTAFILTSEFIVPYKSYVEVLKYTTINRTSTSALADNFRHLFRNLALYIIL
jgi:Mn2+/Fe2+ NRAMP family transporter